MEKINENNTLKIVLGSLLMVFLLLSFVLNNGITRQSKEFKDEYESLNNKTNASGKEHRKLNIDSNNPFVKTDVKEIVEKIENKETFYVYFGDKLCPWCRSVIEKAIEVANKKKVLKIYYVAIWDDDGNEILRDKWIMRNKIATKEKEGTEEYYKLLKYFSNVLDDYMLNDDDSNSISVGEKRIYAPNFIYIKDGKAINKVDGISKKQIDSREKLTEEMLNDEEEIFNSFFEN